MLQKQNSEMESQWKGLKKNVKQMIERASEVFKLKVLSNCDIGLNIAKLIQTLIEKTSVQDSSRKGFSASALLTFEVR